MTNFYKRKNPLVLLLLISTIVFLLISCELLNSNTFATTNNSTSATLLPPPQSESIENHVISIIESIDSSNPDTLYFPEKIIALGHDAVPVLISMLSSDDVITRWASVYALTRISQPEDIPDLKIGLFDENFGIRTRIAATLLWLGDESGLSILKEALSSSEMMLYSHPPERVAEYAYYVLEQLLPSALGNIESTMLKVYSSPVGMPLNDVSVSKDGCVVKIELKLQFSGAGATTSLAAKWKSGILKMWHEKESSLCCKTDLSVFTKVGGAVNPEYAQINVVKVPPGGEHRSNNSLGGSVSNGTSNDVFGSWASNDSPGVAAHETGHAMGIPDEYTDGADGYSEPTGEAVGEANGTGIPGIMAQTWLDNENQAPEAKPRHIDQILKFYEVVCICCGVVTLEANGPGMSFLFETHTCNGTNWEGFLAEDLVFGGTSAYAESKFEIDISETTNNGEASFSAEGSWNADGEKIEFQDSLHLSLAFFPDLSSTMNMQSTGGELIVEGQSISVPQALPNSFGENSLTVEKYQFCE